MAEDPQSLVREYLRRMSADIAGLREDVREVKGRLGSLEEQMVQFRHDIVRLAHRIGRIDGRLQRIERRLDLAAA